MHETASAGSAAELCELPLEKLREFSPLIEEDVFTALRLEDALAARTHHSGATRPQRAGPGRERSRR